MALELRSTVINARDLPRMVAFWPEALGGEVRGPVDAGRQFVAIGGSHVTRRGTSSASAWTTADARRSATSAGR